MRFTPGAVSGSSGRGILTLNQSEFLFIRPIIILGFDPTLDVDKGIPSWVPQPIQKLLQKSNKEPILQAPYGNGQALVSCPFPGTLSMHDLPSAFWAHPQKVVARDPEVRIKTPATQSSPFAQYDGEGKILIAARGELNLIELKSDQEYLVSSLLLIAVSNGIELKKAKVNQKVDPSTGESVPTFIRLKGPGTAWLQTQPEPPKFPNPKRRTE